MIWPEMVVREARHGIEAAKQLEVVGGCFEIATNSTKQNKYPKQTDCSVGISPIRVTTALFPISTHRKPKTNPKNRKKYQTKFWPRVSVQDPFCTPKKVPTQITRADGADTLVLSRTGRIHIIPGVWEALKAWEQPVWNRPQLQAKSGVI